MNSLLHCLISIITVNSSFTPPILQWAEGEVSSHPAVSWMEGVLPSCSELRGRCPPILQWPEGGGVLPSCNELGAGVFHPTVTWGGGVFPSFSDLRRRCRLIYSLSRILQKDLINPQVIIYIYIYIYINICMYIYRQNHDKTTMHYYVQFYCMITYNLLRVFSLHIRWLLSNIYSWRTRTKRQSF